MNPYIKVPRAFHRHTEPLGPCLGDITWFLPVAGATGLGVYCVSRYTRQEFSYKETTRFRKWGLK